MTSIGLEPAFGKISSSERHTHRLAEMGRLGIHLPGAPQVDIARLVALSPGDHFSQV
jgi:hypothetical protein